MKKYIYFLLVIAATLAGTSACNEVDRYTNLPELREIVNEGWASDPYRIFINVRIDYPEFYTIESVEYREAKDDAPLVSVKDRTAVEGEENLYRFELTDLTPDTWYVYRVVCVRVDGERFETGFREVKTPSDETAMEMGQITVSLYEGAEPYAYTDDIAEYFCTLTGNGAGGRESSGRLERISDNAFRFSPSVMWGDGMDAELTVAARDVYGDTGFPRKVSLGDLSFYDCLIGTRKFKYPDRCEVTLEGRMAYLRLTVNSKLDKGASVFVRSVEEMVIGGMFDRDGNFYDTWRAAGHMVAFQDYRNYSSIEPGAKGQVQMFAAIPQKFDNGWCEFVVSSGNYEVRIPVPGNVWESHKVYDYQIDIDGPQDVTLWVGGVAINGWIDGGSEDLGTVK